MLKNAASRLPLFKLLIRLSETFVVIWRATRSSSAACSWLRQRRERLLAVPLHAPDPRNIGSAISGNRDLGSERPFLHPFNIRYYFGEPQGSFTLSRAPLTRGHAVAMQKVSTVR